MFCQCRPGAELGWSPAIFAEIEAAMTDERGSGEKECAAREVRDGDEEVVARSGARLPGEATGVALHPRFGLAGLGQW
jgi:hypothetical protein